MEIIIRSLMQRGVDQISVIVKHKAMSPKLRNPSKLLM